MRMTAQRHSSVTQPLRGWVLFDGQCTFCTGLAQRFECTLAAAGYAIETLQAGWVRGRLGLHPDTPLTEMRLLTQAGDVLGGSNAIVELARHIWWGRPLAAAARWAPVRSALAWAYAWLARNRHCLGAPCERRRTRPRV
jgi:predicted DCC family thiol-disulfide oxidoreductase YuxK